MSFFEWSHQDNLGIAAIDDDHRKFVGLINELHGAVRQGNGPELQGKILANLIIHVNSHFAAEEDLMRKWQYPMYREHKSEHHVFAQRVYEMQRQFALGNQSLAIETLNSLSNWFQHHIKGTDSKLRPCALKNLMIK